MIPSTTAEEVTERRSIKWLYLIVVLLVALLIGIACMLLLCRTKSGTTIGPWKTGLSGQLQKAFVTGKVFICYLIHLKK
jgi:hypothetical protein